jgi:hypothetical protein
LYIKPSGPIAVEVSAEIVTIVTLVQAPAEPGGPVHTPANGSSKLSASLFNELSEDDRDRGMICVPSELDDEDEDAETGLEPLDSISTG